MLANGIPQRKSPTDELCKGTTVRWIEVVSECRSSSFWMPASFVEDVQEAIRLKK